jgi:carboxypeptidase Q
MRHFYRIVICAGLISTSTYAQVDTNVIKKIQQEAMTNSQMPILGQQLMDDIGPRLMGTPQMLQANEWVKNTYTRWGIEAVVEQYGTWKGWERGITEVVLTHPRMTQLQGMQLAWSPATPKGSYAEAEVIVVPALADSIALANWLPQAKGKIVLISKPELSGRPESNWKEFALASDYEAFVKDKEKASQEWNEQLKKMKTSTNLLQKQLEQAGAVALISSYWSGGWGVNKIFGTKTEHIAHIDLAMEDYQMLYRMVQRGIQPKLKIRATSKALKPLPAQNTIGTIKSNINPEEYVMLSAHLDSWDAGTGATDNGTGTILMMEVMRILKKYYPNPKRSIIVGHWGGEEQGLNGSRAFVADHQALMPKISVLFNQDNGTGRFNWINTLGFIDAYDYFNRWFNYLPEEHRKEIKMDIPGNPGGRGGSDYAAFLPYDVPAFFLISNSWDYGTYTWHTNLDTYDKIVWEDMKRNAVTLATMVYLACEEPQMFSRKKAQLPLDIKTGERMAWPKEKEPQRDSDNYFK